MCIQFDFLVCFACFVSILLFDLFIFFFFFQAEDGIRDKLVTGVQTCALPISAKWIPYTASLKREFQCGIRAWVADMFLHDADLLHGAGYWSVSPAQRCEEIGRASCRERV